MSFIGKITVESPGMFTTVQDGGRFGYRRFGVPQSGVMDDYAARLANILVGNEESAPLLEITITGPQLRFTAPVNIAITGADMAAQVNGIKIKRYETVYLMPGDRLSFGKLISGCRTYLAIRGGLIADYLMESTSTYVPAGFGGHHGRQLRKGDLLFYNQKYYLAQKLITPYVIRPNYETERRIRILKGPEWQLLGSRAEKELETQNFNISNDSDRMGIRLKGKLLPIGTLPQILSSPLACGSIQLIPSGELIIVMSDGQTTGGYPRIGAVISVDLPYVAQMKPGDQIRFQTVEEPHAKALFLHREEKLKSGQKMSIL